MSRAESQQVLDGQFTVEADRLMVSKLAEEVLKETLAMCMHSDGGLGVLLGWFLNFGWFLCEI